MNSLYNDGGRIWCGFKPHHLYKTVPPGDCVVRAIAIACDIDYGKVNKLLRSMFREYDKKVRLKDPNAFSSWQAHRHGAQSGVPSHIYEPLLRSLGFAKLDTKAHRVKRVSCLARREPCAPTARLGLPWLPPVPADRLAFPGAYIVRVAKHMACVRDGDLHDIQDCRKKRVYSLWARRFEMDQDLRNYFND